MQIPTIKVKNPHDPGGYMIINLEDFDPRKHERFDHVGWENKPATIVPDETPKKGRGRGKAKEAVQAAPEVADHLTPPPAPLNPVERARLDVIDIEGWRGKAFMTQRSLAWQVSNSKEAQTGDAVNAILEAEEARRKG